jgi:indole-3-glycerol phosphate synthase
MTELDRILAYKVAEVAEARAKIADAELERLIANLPPARDFRGALVAAAGVGVIAEVKKASPSAGLIRADFDPVQIAKIYADNGASCLSVLTDAPSFQGHLDYLRAIRAAVRIPLLRKDFIIDRYQLLEARAAGADCALLIAEALPGESLGRLHRESLEMGLQTLIEIYDPENLPRVLALGATLVGVNNRDLRTFRVRLEHTIELAAKIPPSVCLVGESGIRTREDVLRLEAAGVKAILVGESLMRADDIGKKLRELLR